VRRKEKRVKQWKGGFGRSEGVLKEGIREGNLRIALEGQIKRGGCGER
jgi:hypothetical protein